MPGGRHLTLIKLPPEIHLAISAKVDQMDIIHLRATCKYFRSLLPEPKELDCFELKRSEYAKRRELFACSYCILLLPAKLFSDTEVEGPLGAGGEDAKNRFCIDCSTIPPRGKPGYDSGSKISIQGKMHVLCIKCDAIKPIPIGCGPIVGFLEHCVDCWPRTPMGRFFRKEKTRLRQLRAAEEEDDHGEDVRRSSTVLGKQKADRDGEVQDDGHDHDHDDEDDDEEEDDDEDDDDADDGEDGDSMMILERYVLSKDLWSRLDRGTRRMNRIMGGAWDEDLQI